MRFVYYNPQVTTKNSTRAMNKKPIDKLYGILKIIQIQKKEGKERTEEQKREETNRTE